MRYLPFFAAAAILALTIPAAGASDRFMGKVRAYDAKSGLIAMHNGRTFHMRAGLVPQGLKPGDMVTIMFSSPNHRGPTSIALGNYH